jgi:ArsR family transcriptional regulator
MLAEGGECMCGGIASRLPLAQATVSQHLKVLKEAGLIQGEIDPPRVCYCIDPPTLKRLHTLVGELGPATTRRNP